MLQIYRPCRSISLLVIFLIIPFLLPAQSIQGSTAQQRLANAKLAPSLHQALQKSSPSTYRIVVKDKAAFITWLQEQKITSFKEAVGNTYTLSSISTTQLNKLLNCPHISFIDRGNRKPEVEAELRDIDFAANNIPAVQTRYQGLDGDGMGVSVKEESFDPNDMDLKSRVLLPGTFGQNYTPHATTMATIIGGAGNSGPRGKGVAPKALLASSNFANLLPDNSNELLNNGIGIQNHSYGVGVENYYGVESVAYDAQTFQNPQLLHIFSSGNSGDKADASGRYANLTGFANLTGQFKNSKNTLSIGALEPGNNVGVRSSKGPAYDGRVKPELVAYGIGGTSEAAAVASGVALLVQQAYKNQYTGALPSAALVKAILINSADDVGKTAVDYESGFGNVDALGAIKSVLESRFIEASVASGEEKTFTIRVPGNTRQLKVTIVWHDKEAEANAAKALINDLDLQVRRIATGDSWLPWVLSTFPHADSLARPARRGPDHLNNVEQVTINLPASGEYELVVKGYQVQDKGQEFSLVYEYENELEWLYPSLGLSLQAGQINRLRWQQGTINETAQLEYRFSQDRDWRPIAEVNTSDLYYDWQAPDTVAMAELRLSTANASITSERFILTKSLKLRVGFDCSDKTMVYWPALKGVQQYQLLQVDKAYLSPLLTTSDTLAILDKKAIENLSDFILVAPIVEDMQGETSDAIAYERQGAGCYIKSFLPEYFVMDTIKLNLEVSTLYQLASLTLERKKQQDFEAVQRIKPTSSLRFNLVDPSPKIGSNFYRVKAETVTGQVIYSEVEEAIYANNGFIQVYPNPVEAGKPFNIAVAHDFAQVQLYDQLGRLLRDSEEYGVIKTLDTTGLLKGLYILRVKTENGTILSSRILIL